MRQVLLTYQGRTQRLVDWAREIGISRFTLWARLDHGWSVEKTLTTPLVTKNDSAITYTYQGQSKSLVEWAQEFGISPQAVKNRLKFGWTFEKALTTPSRTGRNVGITFRGQTKSVSEWAREFGISPEALRTRLKFGWNFEKALTTPVRKKPKPIRYRGQKKRLKEWADEFGIALPVLQVRLRLGWTIEKALTTPVRPMRRRGELPSSADAPADG